MQIKLYILEYFKIDWFLQGSYIHIHRYVCKRRQRASSDATLNKLQANCRQLFQRLCLTCCCLSEIIIRLKIKLAYDIYACMYVCLYLCTYVCDFAVFTTFTSIISKFRTKFYFDLSTYLHMLVFACVSTTYVVVCMSARPIVCDYNEIWKFARNISVFFRRSCWRLAYYLSKPKSSQNESPIIKVHFLFIKKEGSLKRFTKKFVFFTWKLMQPLKYSILYWLNIFFQTNLIICDITSTHLILFVGLIQRHTYL